MDERKPQPPRERFRAELTAGIRHIAHMTALRQIVVGVGLALLVVGFAETLIFTIIQQVLHRPPSSASSARSRASARSPAGSPRRCCCGGSVTRSWSASA